MNQTVIKTQPSVMPPQKDFSKVPQAHIQRSVFDRSHGHKTTMDVDYLYPVLCDEIYPGDTLSCRASIFARLSTPLKPIMDNLHVDTHFWFVPYRLIWNNFQKFMGEQDNPGDSISYLIPQVTSPVGGPAVGSIHDYMSIPTVGQVDAAKTLTWNSLWLRAYNLIWNQNYRDQNFQNSLVVDKTDGPDVYANYSLQKRGKRHDYFTSCLPSAQKGSAVTLPLGTSAPVLWDSSSTAGVISRYASTGALATSQTGFYTAAGTALTYSNPGSDKIVFDPNGSLYTDLATATAASINTLRLAEQMQSFLERDARGGTRYTEITQSHFGVTSPDARLQRPEYLGGGSHPINFHPVAQSNATGASGTSTPQGNLAATATASLSGDGFTKSFTEHGVILGLVSVRADLSYQQGLNRMFSRRTRYDMYWPEFAHIGEQAVLSKEIYADGNTADDNVFGYQERYAELRYKPSLITGKMRSTASGTLDIWHAAEKFTTRPTLSSTFIQSAVPIDRLVAVPSEPDFVVDMFFKYTHARPLPVFSVPQLGSRM